MENQARVLIVDDMPINRIVLSSILATHGVMSDQVESGSECLSLCEKNSYDLILLDHRMPDMDGVDTLVQLKELFAARGRAVPVICHTTAEGRKNINLYKAAGFADVLIKPIEPKELFEVIMTYLPDLRHVVKAAEPAAPAPVLSTEEDTREEIEKLPLWLKIVPHIDLVSGVKSCGSAEDYMDALYIFYAAIDEKSQELDQFLLSEEYTMYALRVHSLKSMARLVGARDLGDLAARLEEAARKEDYVTVKAQTPALLKAYREFRVRLAPITQEEVARARKQEPAVPDAEARRKAIDRSRSVLLIQSGQAIVKKGIENHLTQAGFRVVSIPDDPDRIIAARSEADLIVYYPGSEDNSKITIAMNLLGEICQDDAKLLCLTGDINDLKTAMHTGGAYRVSRTYPRPVDLAQFVPDMKYLAVLEEEYHRRKTIYVVDDDTTYLPVIERWLSPVCNVSCFSGGDEVLQGLATVTPDLLLLDYEMPEMNGCDLMLRIRQAYPYEKIPIIFLTGKNDRELVFKALECKPDGYLLKTSQKDTILDTIFRFFAESMFRASLQNP